MARKDIISKMKKSMPESGKSMGPDVEISMGSEDDAESPEQEASESPEHEAAESPEFEAKEHSGEAMDLADYSVEDLLAELQNRLASSSKKAPSSKMEY